MHTFFKDWNFLRVTRLLIGLSLLAYGYFIMDWLIIMIGFVVGYMAVTNSGCNPFTNNGCDVKYKKDIEH